MSSAIHPINPNDVFTLLSTGEAVVLDVRATPDYVQCHISGAHNLPYGTFQPTQALDLVAPAQKIVVSCYHGISSQVICRVLLNCPGVTEVYNLTGGFEGWQQAGLPTVSSGKP